LVDGPVPWSGFLLLPSSSSWGQSPLCGRPGRIYVRYGSLPPDPAIRAGPKKQTCVTLGAPMVEGGALTNRGRATNDLAYLLETGAYGQAVSKSNRGRAAAGSRCRGNTASSRSSRSYVQLHRFSARRVMGRMQVGLSLRILGHVQFRQGFDASPRWKPGADGGGK